MLDIVGVPEFIDTEGPLVPAGLLGLRFNCISITPSIRSFTVRGLELLLVVDGGECEVVQLVDEIADAVVAMMWDY